MEKVQVKRRSKKVRKKSEEAEEIGEPSEPNFEPILSPEIAALLKNEVESFEENAAESSCEQSTNSTEPAALVEAVEEISKNDLLESSEEQTAPEEEAELTNFHDLSLSTEEIKTLEMNVTASPTAPAQLYPFLPVEDLLPEPTAPEAPPEPFLNEELLREVTPMNDAQLSTLYHNYEVAMTKEFVSEFYETQKGLQSHPLYELLSSYLRARTKLLSGQMELDQMTNEARAKQDSIWTPGETVVRESGKCLDGNNVFVSHTYPTAEMSQEGLNALGRSLSSIRSVLNENISLHAYRAEVLRLQIEQLLQETLILYANVPQNSPVQLLPPRPPATALWDALSVLFLFSRKQTKDAVFMKNCRDWILRLGATLLRVATAKDHIFLLLHVLFNPPGVTQWATPLIQVPLKNIIESYPSTNSALLDHAVAVLAVLMEPPVKIEKCQEDPCWVLVDEDGEEEVQSGLAENDLVALLNQVPIDGIFRHVLGIQRKDGVEIYFPESASESSLLRLMAFASSLVLLLGKGLKTYDSQRYRQFAKRLSRLVRHTVQYVSDVWEIFRVGASQRGHNPNILARLQVEYDNLLLRATQCIFSSQRLGAWQFLAIIPYNVASCQVLWQLFHLLHHEYQQEMTWSNYHIDWKKEMSILNEEFESKLSSMPEAEVYFLLNTFANMAMARGPEDADFVLTITLDLFRVGFVSEKTQELCSKTCRSLLSNLVNKHPYLMSPILVALRENMDKIGPLSLYLVKELPLKLWSPADADMNILSEWIICNPNMLQSSVARSILGSLDWNSLEWQVQLQVATFVVDACLRHAPEKSGPASPGTVAEGVSSLAAMVRSQSSPEQCLTSWAWGMISRLRLHANDSRNRQVDVLSMVCDLEDQEILHKGVKDKEPIACFVALLATSWGHSIPLVCSKGFLLLSTLLSHGKYDAVCECLHFILPLFMPCADSLTSNKDFASVFLLLITADRGYVKMAKNLIMTDSLGPVLKQVANMIQAQFLNYKNYHLESPHALTELWLSLLLSLPDWNRDPSIIHLLDIVLRESFSHHYSKEVAKNKFRDLFRQGISKQGNALSSIMSWVSMNSGISSLLGKISCSEAPWLALYVIEVEQEENELKNGLWKQFLLELADMNKSNLDQAMKKAANTLKVAPVPISYLGLYRWAQQALDSSLDHPLLPIFWQKFFTLFLTRVPQSENSGADRGSMGLKFFEGIINASYLKRLKRRLVDAAEFYETRATDPGFTGEGAEEEGGERRLMHGQTARLLRTFSLWLEETRLHDQNLYLPALPLQYDPNRLGRLLVGDQNPWLEFLDVEDLQEKQREALTNWKIQHFRSCDYKVPRNKSEDQTTALSRMLSRLQAYDHPVAAPQLLFFKNTIPFLPREELLSPAVTLSNLEHNFEALLEFAQVHALHTSELAALDCTLLEFIPSFYKETEVKVPLRKSCDLSARKKSNAKECSGAFRITIQVRESRVNSSTKHQISQNRKEHSNLIARSLQPPPQKVCLSAVYAENLINKLIMEPGVKDTGVAVFYYLVARHTEEISFYPPTKQLLSCCLELLGQNFISKDERECEKLLKTILASPHLTGLLSPHFSPHLAPTPSFLNMYSKVVAASNPDVCFAILSKFDVQQWLTRSRPRLKERSQFIQSLGQAFIISGKEPPDGRLILHESYLRHLRAILLHDFPEHYGEILNMALKLSEAQTLSLDIWWAILDSLTPNDQQRIRHGNGLRDQLRFYATQQRLLGLNEIRETAALLASYFMKERLQFGLHGVYPKYRFYIEPLSVFLSMIGHALVIGTLHQGRGALGDSLAEQLWPVLNDLFSPWILPFTGQRHQTAAWIQQLTDDRTVLLPWTAQDASFAKIMCDAFVGILSFLLDTLPASTNSLCFVFQFYAIHFTHPAEHVLSTIHHSFLALPWDRFWPRAIDMEAMIRLSEQYLPHNHPFLGAIFIQVPWVMWIQKFPNERNHLSLMGLLVKLSSEPSVKQNPRVVALICECKQQLSWHLVDSSSFDQVLNWFVMSSDPRVVLPDHPELHPVDVAVFELLEEIAGFTPSSKHFHSTTVRKRLAFVRACSKLLVSCSTRFKALISKNPATFVKAFSKLLNQIEKIVFQTVPPAQQISESALLLGELLSGSMTTSPLNEILVCGLQEWLTSHTGGSVVVLGLLKALSVSVTEQKALGSTIEATLESFFRDPSVPNTSWSRAVSILQPAVPLQAGKEPLEHLLVKEGQLLSLYAFLLKQGLPDHTFADILDWLAVVKVSEESEQKIPLLWNAVLQLIRKGAKSENVPSQFMQKINKFSQHLTVVGEDKGWNLLGAIGLRKQSRASVRMRILARVTAALVLAQFYKCGEEFKSRLISEAPGALGNLSSSSTRLQDENSISPTDQTLQAIAALESMAQAKLNPPELKEVVEFSIRKIRDQNTSLDNIESVYAEIAQQLYKSLML
ncbi:ectopic P granules protein 5 homolog [Neocloeon triangulifer]|uniref:ectopic P granules protein 5 homolog n=1 Tax=Neocloeon triangulifer TaxID=2078957 RepID=UPI00286FAE14|nr:ectopic P granules protein 5 homolog [Neocloeon triangulifer]